MKCAVFRRSAIGLWRNTAQAFRPGIVGLLLAKYLRMHDAGVQTGSIPLVVDPSRGYRAANLELVQGLYLVTTGVWPLVSPLTFQTVTGAKREMWPSDTVGTLAAVMGTVLLYSGSRKRRPSEVILLAMGSAAAFAALDIVHVAKRRIAPVYLIDAAAQLGLLAWWAFARGHLPWRRTKAGVRHVDARSDPGPDVTTSHQRRSASPELPIVAVAQTSHSRRMATRAENARYEMERSKPNRPKQPPKPRRDVGVDTSLPGTSATDRKAGAGSSAARNRKTAGTTKAAFELEDSKGQPSRKSTRGAANRIKQNSNLTRRQKRRVASPKARALRSA